VGTNFKLQVVQQSEDAEDEAVAVFQPKGPAPLALTRASASSMAGGIAVPLSVLITPAGLIYWAVGESVFALWRKLRSFRRLWQI
jgi:hypothetical protein